MPHRFLLYETTSGEVQYAPDPLAVSVSGETVKAETSGKLFVGRYYPAPPTVGSGAVTEVVTDSLGRILVKISGEVVVGKVSGEPVKVSGEVVQVSGQAVKVSGETVSLPATQVVKVSGETVALASGTGPILAKVSGETIVAKVSGETLIAKVSGETVVAETSGRLFAGRYYPAPPTVGSGAVTEVMTNSLGKILTEDTGVNTNPQKYLQDNHWNSDQVTISAAGAGGQQNLGAAVAAGKKRRIKELTIRHAGTNNTVVTLLVSGGATKLTIDVPPQTTRVWGSEDGREFTAAEQPAAQSSDVTGGNTFISAAGIEV